ncbi:hypothetical protein OG799_04625 [Micromonospora sp. NBC_00898]|nr:hypothetical protein OG799_04625 [Micromonospora sp. NBC_00898]
MTTWRYCSLCLARATAGQSGLAASPGTPTWRYVLASLALEIFHPTW